jgi:hypothetical protein
MQNWEYIRLGVSYSTRSITTHDSVYELVDVYSNGTKILSKQSRYRRLGVGKHPFR